MATSQLLHVLLLVAASLAPASATIQQDTSGTVANPVRKVVTMLQAMQSKVSEEAKTEKELYERFMCYCKTSGADLQASISGAETKIPAVGSDIEEAEQQKVQAEEALKRAELDRSTAKGAMAAATAMREKEAAAYADFKAEYDANIHSINDAVTSLTKGMAGGFLQTSAASKLRHLVENYQDIIDEDRQTLLVFLDSTQTSQYVPSSTQVTGILKEMGDDLAKTLAEATETEKNAKASYEDVIASKTKEVDALTASIESKNTKIGELAVNIVMMKNDLSDTQAALLEDQKFLAELDSSCKSKTADWEERVQTRSQELAAIAETIKILNDDDALDLFKATLPSAGSSMLQVGTDSSAKEEKVLAMIHAAREDAPRRDRAQLDLLVLALTGKKVDFSKVVKMIGEMVGMLKEEQKDDDFKKEYCAVQFDRLDDKKKGLERTMSEQASAIEEAESAIAALKEEIEVLTKGIAALDKAVAEATEQRKEENKEFTELMASDSAAKELLGIAKNRLNKFYNAKLYKPPAKTELTAAGRIEASFSGTEPPTEAPGGIAGTGVTVFAQIAKHTLHRDAPAPPPETYGSYSKKSEESTGVISMLDILIKDLDKDMTEAKTDEKNAQASYEKTMKDSAMKRLTDSKSLMAKGEAKANAESDLESHKGQEASAKKKFLATVEVIASLHAECDWLLQYFDVRKEARAGEVDALNRAKAVLSGADYSLLEMSSTRTGGFLEK